MPRSGKLLSEAVLTRYTARMACGGARAKRSGHTSEARAPDRRLGRGGPAGAGPSAIGTRASRGRRLGHLRPDRSSSQSCGVVQRFVEVLGREGAVAAEDGEDLGTVVAVAAEPVRYSGVELGYLAAVQGQVAGADDQA